MNMILEIVDDDLKLALNPFVFLLLCTWGKTAYKVVETVFFLFRKKPLSLFGNIRILNSKVSSLIIDNNHKCTYIKIVV